MLLRYFFPAPVLVVNLQKYTTPPEFSPARHFPQIFKEKHGQQEAEQPHASISAADTNLNSLRIVSYANGKLSKGWDF